MARRKNVKRIDPRYFLHETVNRGEELEEGYDQPGEGGEEHPCADPEYQQENPDECANLEEIVSDEE